MFTVMLLIVGEPMIFRWYGMLIVSEWLDCLLGCFAKSMSPFLKNNFSLFFFFKVSNIPLIATEF